jgi:phage terminase large subunit-like protein
MKLSGEMQRAVSALQEMARRKLSLYRPHPKQLEFHRAGSNKPERALFAGNRCGKSLSCAMESAYHATGLYPDWWQGHRFSKPTLGWACGTSNEITRDVVQQLLLGDSEINWGTGSIPGAAIQRIDKARGISGAVDKLFVKHVGGGMSIVQFKSYEQTWKKFTSADVDWVWCDEEPDELIYKECLARITTTKGIIYLSLIPLQGPTHVVNHFYPRPTTKSRHLTMMTIDDALHMDEEMRKTAIEKYDNYEREARLRGIPMLGSGRIFPVADSLIEVPHFEVPDYWPQLIGMDFGWDHPTAAAQLAWDRDVDCFYVVREYRVAEEIPIVHAAAVKAWGNWMNVAWPHDGHRVEAIAGAQMAQEYREHGLRMYFEHATFDNGSNSLEAGVIDILDRMRSNRWKVFNTCPMWLEEFRGYHRKDGRIVKERDDLLSASRYALMMKRIARTKVRRVRHTRPGNWDPLQQGEGDTRWDRQ